MRFTAFWNFTITTTTACHFSPNESHLMDLSTDKVHQTQREEVQHKESALLQLENNSIVAGRDVIIKVVSNQERRNSMECEHGLTLENEPQSEARAFKSWIISLPG